MDTVGGETFCDSFAATQLYGRVVSLLSTSCSIAHINTARQRNLSIGYVQIAAPQYFGLHHERLAQTRILEQGAKLIEQACSRFTSALRYPWKKSRRHTG